MEPPSIIIALIAYLIGSIPFGLLLTKLAGLGDVRAIGSGNIGATNVLRTGRRGLAAATLLLDIGKGMLAIYVAWRLKPELIYIAGYFAVVGHIFPLWLKFKGGKGVATYLGTLLALHFLLGLVFIAAWALTFAFSRISSLASLIATVAVIIASAAVHEDILLFTCLLGGFIMYKHKDNIARLFQGTEPKFGK